MEARGHEPGLHLRCPLQLPGALPRTCAATSSENRSALFWSAKWLDCTRKSRTCCRGGVERGGGREGGVGAEPQNVRPARSAAACAACALPCCHPCCTHARTAGGHPGTHPATQPAAHLLEGGELAQLHHAQHRGLAVTGGWGDRGERRREGVRAGEAVPTCATAPAAPCSSPLPSCSNCSLPPKPARQAGRQVASPPCLHLLRPQVGERGGQQLRHILLHICRVGGEGGGAALRGGHIPQRRLDGIALHTRGGCVEGAWWAGVAVAGAASAELCGGAQSGANTRQRRRQRQRRRRACTMANRWCRMRACSLKPGLWKVSVGRVGGGGWGGVELMCAGAGPPGGSVGQQAARCSHRSSTACQEELPLPTHPPPASLTRHDGKHLLHQLRVEGLVELRGRGAARKHDQQLHEQVEAWGEVGGRGGGGAGRQVGGWQLGIQNAAGLDGGHLPDCAGPASQPHPAQPPAPAAAPHPCLRCCARCAGRPTQSSRSPA